MCFIKEPWVKQAQFQSQQFKFPGFLCIISNLSISEQTDELELMQRKATKMIYRFRKHDLGENNKRTESI